MTSTIVPPHLSQELSVAFQASEEAKRVVMSHFGRLKSVDEKLNEGLVSEADKQSEEVIRKVVLQAFPHHSILGEEGGMSSGEKSGPLWIIDPIDGTTNYVYEFPFFCISIGLQIDGELAVGVIDAPLMNWRFHAVKGGGAFLNGKPIHASSRKTLREGLFATGFAYRYGAGDLEEQFRILEHIVINARGVRRAGSAALDLCMVANGIYDGYWEGIIKPWDTAAGVLIAKEAGAIVTNYKGEPYDVLNMKDVVACNPHVHGAVLDLIRSKGH